MRDASGRVPEGHWHLSDTHGMVVYFGPDRWLEPTAPERGSGTLNGWTHAELSALVDQLNRAASIEVAAREALHILDLWKISGPRVRRVRRALDGDDR